VRTPGRGCDLIQVSTRFWLALAIAGAVLATGSLAFWQATRPASSAGAPVAPASTTETSRAGTVSGSSPAAPPNGEPVPTQDTNPQLSAQQAAEAPRRITITTLGIDAPIDPVGVDPAGTMALPPDVRRVGWYEFSPLPGSDAGSVVLAGHVDNARQGAGALFDLRSVPVGARIVVQGGDGVSHTYRVTGRELFVKKRLPVENLFAIEGPPRLVIITCGGPFQQDIHSYRDNLVVAAEPVGT
jgi:Sortase domain